MTKLISLENSVLNSVHESVSNSVWHSVNNPIRNIVWAELSISICRSIILSIKGKKNENHTNR